MSLEKALTTLGDESTIGFPSVIAMRTVQRHLDKGGELPETHAHVTDPIWLADRRVSSLKVMAKDAWNKAHDEERTPEEKMDLMRALEKHLENGQLGLGQDLGISEGDYHRQLFALRCDQLDGKGIYETHIYSHHFEPIMRKVDRLERDTMLSEDEIESIRDMCQKRHDTQIEKIKEGNNQVYADLDAKINDPETPASERVDLIWEATRVLDRNQDRSPEAVKKIRELYDLRDQVQKSIIVDAYHAITSDMKGVEAYDALEELEEEARKEGMDIDDVLEMDPQDYYAKKDQYLLGGADDLIAASKEQAADNPRRAYQEFNSRYSQMFLNMAQSDGKDVQAIIDHKRDLLKAATKHGFDTAVAIEEPEARLDALVDFTSQTNTRMLEGLFGKQKAGEMLDVSRSAFRDKAAVCLGEYRKTQEQRALFEADDWRRQASAEWTDIVDDVPALEAEVEKRGHEFPRFGMRF